MSVIGNSIQNSLANANAALREQQAAQTAESDEETKRRNRIQREEELARESVRETAGAHGARVQETGGRRHGRRPTEKDTPEEDKPDAEGHIDLFA